MCINTEEMCVFMKSPLKSVDDVLSACNSTDAAPTGRGRELIFSLQSDLCLKVTASHSAH